MLSIHQGPGLSNKNLGLAWLWQTYLVASLYSNTVSDLRSLSTNEHSSQIFSHPSFVPSLSSLNFNFKVLVGLFLMSIKVAKVLFHYELCLTMPVCYQAEDNFLSKLYISESFNTEQTIFSDGIICSSSETRTQKL